MESPAKSSSDEGYLDILFLDDDPQRTVSFLEAYPTATAVATVQGCIAELERKDWYQVCLDHDLGGEVYVDSDREDTGMEVVRWVEKNKPKVEQFIVHSYNSVAAAIMVERLRACGYKTYRIPFKLLLPE